MRRRIAKSPFPDTKNGSQDFHIIQNLGSIWIMTYCCLTNIFLVCFLALIMMIGSDVVIDISSDVALHVFFCRF